MERGDPGQMQVILGRNSMAIENTGHKVLGFKISHQILQHKAFHFQIIKPNWRGCHLYMLSQRSSDRVGTPNSTHKLKIQSYIIVWQRDETREKDYTLMYSFLSAGVTCLFLFYPSFINSLFIISKGPTSRHTFWFQSVESFPVDMTPVYLSK